MDVEIGEQLEEKDQNVGIAIAGNMHWIVFHLFASVHAILVPPLISGDIIKLVVQGMQSASLGKASVWREASRIVREEGVRAFWKGNLVTIAHRLPYSSISFYSFECYKNLLQVIFGVESQGDNISADLCIRLLGGGLAGITAASVTYPLDLVRTCLAAQTNMIYYRGIWHALHTITNEKKWSLASIKDLVQLYWVLAQIWPLAFQRTTLQDLIGIFTDLKTQLSWSALHVGVFQELQRQQRGRLRMQASQ